MANWSPGRGAIFTLDFPELPQSRAAGTTATGARATASASGTEAVLVVEDQPEVRQLMIDTLTRAGFRVYSAAGPHEAIALAARHAGPLPLMVTDVIMPQMNGPALAERLTAVRPELRVLFVSGYTAQLPVMDGLGARARFLAKPFAPSTLVMTVRAMLDESIGVPS